MLGVGDFYYELGVQVVELCVATSHRNGGVLSLEEVLLKLNHRRRPDNQISRYPLRWIEMVAAVFIFPNVLYIEFHILILSLNANGGM